MESHSKKSRRNNGAVGLWLVLVLAVSILFYQTLRAPGGGIPLFINESPDPLPIRIVLVGDIMMDRSVRSSVEKHLGGDYGALFSNTGYLQDADIAFANLEGPVATGGRNVGSRFSFRMAPASLTALRDAGIDIVSFANNHVGDYSTDAFLETLTRLNENSVAYAGAGQNYDDATTPRIRTVRDVRIGFLAATDVGPDWMKATADKPGLPAQAGILLASDPTLPSIIAAAKAQTDVLVMSFHWGSEYSPANAHQEALAHAAIDAGADIVVGAHPHVMQRVEDYNGKPIFYSLGNFIFDQYFSPYTLHGMVAEVSIDPQTKAITHQEFVSEQNTQYVPQPLLPFDASMLVTKTFTP